MSNKKVDNLLDQLLESETILEKEADIINSIAQYYEDRGEISLKQFELLESIVSKDNDRR